MLNPKKKNSPGTSEKNTTRTKIFEKIYAGLNYPKKRKGRWKRPTTVNEEEKKKQPTHKLIKQDDQNLQQPSGAAQPTAGDAPTSNKSLDVGKSNDDTDLE